MIPGTRWQDDALCTDLGTDYFYPPQGQNQANRKQFCEKCPVQKPCLEFALQLNDEHGIWGGTTPDERREIARKRRDG